MFLFGMAVGAWLNIWPPIFGDWWGFVFAYGLCFLAMAHLTYERGR